MGIFDTIENENIYSDNMLDVIRDYLRDDCVSDNEIKRYWLRAVKYIESYTGQTRENLENKSDIVQAMLAIIADMHDNRSLQGDRTYMNELVASMLDMYRVNLV